MKVAVLGAGLGGLSAAAHLASYGYDVTIFEKESSPGGRARRTSIEVGSESFNLDCGPTVFTMLDIARIPFEALGENMNDWVEMKNVNPSYRGVFADGTELNWPSANEKLDQVISDFAGIDEVIGFKKYEKWLNRLYEVEYEPFIAKNYNSVIDLLKQAKPLSMLFFMGAFRKMDKKTKAYLSDERLQLMLTFQSLYAGVTPDQALAIYSIISYMDLIKGVYYPEGGMCAYPERLADACKSAGVKIEYNSEISKVIKQNSKCEIQTNGTAEIFDAVISNADLPCSYPEIFDLEMPKSVSKGKYSPSCLLYVVGGTFEKKSELAHHNIYFSKNSQKSFDELIKEQTLMSDPSILISNPTYTDKTIAPANKDIFYVLEPSPNLNSNDHFSDSEGIKQRMKSHLKKAGIGVTQLDCEVLLTPNEWEKQGFYKGTPFSLAHTFLQSGPFRPKNEVKQIPGLFLCGTGTTPGVGIPMVIESGRLAAEKARAYLENN